jgi:hypothetical protein
MLHTLRRCERPLIVGNAVASLCFGWLHVLPWLAVPLVTFLSYLFAEERILRLRLGGPAWAGDGYARFVVGTNLYLLTWNLALDGALFVLGGGLGGVV